MKRAVCLLSGGLDSTTCLAIAHREYECYALSFDYGQRHRFELESAARVAAAYGVVHRTLLFDLRQFGGSALTAAIDVPKHQSVAELGVIAAAVSTYSKIDVAHDGDARFESCRQQSDFVRVRSPPTLPSSWSMVCV